MKLRDKIKKLQEAQAEYHEKANGLSPEEMSEERAKFKKLRADINEVLTKDAEDCPDCGNPPVGVFHDGTTKPFEVGCLNCRDHRVREALPEDAIESWNAGNYLPPREEGTLVTRHYDATGKVKEERTLKPRKL
jgi:hypothetical protein